MRKVIHNDFSIIKLREQTQILYFKIQLEPNFSIKQMLMNEALSNMKTINEWK